MQPAALAAPLLIQRIVLDGEIVVLEGLGAEDSAPCPSCGGKSASIHDRYVRRPLDLPWRGHVVRLVLTVRRFWCLHREGPRRTFTSPSAPSWHAVVSGRRLAGGLAPGASWRRDHRPGPLRCACRRRTGRCARRDPGGSPVPPGQERQRRAG